MLKKFSLWLLSSAFTFTVLLFIFITTMTLLIRPGHLKGWVDKSGAYNSLPTTLLSEASKKQAEQKSTSDDISFSDPGVQAAAKAALSPEFLQTSTEDFVDGSFKWLDGTTSKPDFSINVLAAKQTFVTKLGEYAKTRYEALPACAAGALPSSSDPLKIDCKPASGLNIDDQIDAFKLEVLSSKDFLPQSLITADNFGQEEGSTDQSVFSKNPDAPKAYKSFRYSPLVLAGFGLLTAIGVVFLSSSRRVGVKRVGNVLAITSLLSLLLLFLGSVGITKARDQLLKSNSDNALGSMKDTVLAGINALRADLLKTSGIVAGGVLLVGLITLLIVFIVNRRDNPKLPKAERQSKKDSADSPAAPKAPATPVATAPSGRPATPVSTAPELKPRPRGKSNLIQ